MSPDPARVPVIEAFLADAAVVDTIREHSGWAED